MKKLIKYVCLTIALSITLITNVYAFEYKKNDITIEPTIESVKSVTNNNFENGYKIEQKKNVFYFFDSENETMNIGVMDCNAVIKGTLGDYLTKIFSIMKYLGIVLCVGMTIYDFVKALLDSDKEIMNKLVKKAFTRLILVAVLFFLPLFVNLLVSIFVENPCPINF